VDRERERLRAWRREEEVPLLMLSPEH